MATELDLPQLDAKGYAALSGELVEAIPKYTSVWTDFNASDPGITLLQLLAYVADTTLYRINRIPSAAYADFIGLLAGMGGAELDDAIDAVSNDVAQQGGNAILLDGDPVTLDPGYLTLLQLALDLRNGVKKTNSELQRSALAFWNAPYRAITDEDFAQLAVEATSTASAADPELKVARAVVDSTSDHVRVSIISSLPLTYTPQTVEPPDPTDDDPDDDPDNDPSTRDMAADAIVRVTFPLDDDLMWQLDSGYDAILPLVGAYLERRKLLGTPLIVERAAFNPVFISVDVVVESSADPVAVATDIGTRIIALVDPLAGGDAGQGWPYGQELTAAQLTGLLGKLSGIDASQPVSIEVTRIPSVQIGSARVSESTYVAPCPNRTGIPLPLRINVTAVRNTWPLQVGVHARIGVDTLLPRASSQRRPS